MVRAEDIIDIDDIDDSCCEEMIVTNVGGKQTVWIFPTGSEEDTEAAHMKVVRHSPSCLVSSVSTGWKDMFGFKDEEVVGRTLRICQGPETDLSKIDALLDQVASSQYQSKRDVVILYSKCGDSVCVELLASFLGCDQYGHHEFRLEMQRIEDETSSSSDTDMECDYETEEETWQGDRASEKDHTAHDVSNL
ncbi:hypothetical protein GUITHDRAFT_132092 [Guillardia theta CCMP2712]|uniref:PAS domain-containing protein n=1 Tax=Guillardia theta (strain CCMP2712) TaxID=905079 RepID=L1K1C2_GUITC|nr:hypothetical protein GUITHDRAFT_132092 [Guillardia theta CCMP2712]EKX54344.1 hypothetical protein GUITHDRAFT_132092 [Guillardia theta CCMP2712]|eukprot:XP_005841324.1 hypothetical protein GUITHDRAFT_132092 [Guillardia theta CCMP2712]